MLYLLTGDIQIGKTRWLQALVARLEERGVVPYGVIAPGTWVEHGGAAGEASYEKTGIDNELLPSHERIPFARRNDLAQLENAFDPGSQAARAQLAWAIDDNAIAKVNAHFDELGRALSTGDGLRGQASLESRGLLVVDELGRLELLADGGLTSAVALLEKGANRVVPHALIVVRRQLLEVAQERFALSPWGGMCAISPGAEAASELLRAFAL